MRTTVPTLTLAGALAGPSARGDQAATPDAITAQARHEALQHYQAGMEKMRAESFEETAQAFGIATRLDRLFVLAHYQLGQARMALKEYPPAVEALENCITAHKELVILRSTDRALGEKRLDEEIEALRDSLQALTRNPTHVA